MQNDSYKFPMSVFDRSDMNRKLFPIALALLSRETANDVLAFHKAFHKGFSSFWYKF